MGNAENGPRSGSADSLNRHFSYTDSHAISIDAVGHQSCEQMPAPVRVRDHCDSICGIERAVDADQLDGFAITTGDRPATCRRLAE